LLVDVGHDRALCEQVPASLALGETGREPRFLPRAEFRAFWCGALGAVADAVRAATAGFGQACGLRYCRSSSIRTFAIAEGALRV
jgi:hypothetical protein